MLRTVNAEGDTTTYGRTGTFLNGKFIEPQWLMYATFVLHGETHTILFFLDSLAEDDRFFFYIDGEYREVRVAMAKNMIDPESVGVVDRETAPDWMFATLGIDQQVMFGYNGFQIELGNVRNAITTAHGEPFVLNRVNPALCDIAFSDDWQTVTVTQHTDKDVDSATA
jgi:hypothetical protein